MAQCFVIQPFDGGKYDKRYMDIFAPAIRDAGYEPYRVDSDPSASVPIDEITKQIANADVCFAEITEDNPNVWFELGYALASRKEVCLACSKERKTKYPFDVQHRLIISYNTDSTSDYNEARHKIAKRLESLRNKAVTLNRISQVEILKKTEGLTHHEIACLCSIVQNGGDPSQPVANWRVVQDMEKMGFTRLATQLAIYKLIKKDLIQSKIEDGFDRNAHENYSITVYEVTALGVDWLIDNESELQLRGDDIPF